MTSNVIAATCVVNEYVQATMVRECAIFNNVASTHWMRTSTLESLWYFPHIYLYISSHIHRIQANLKILSEQNSKETRHMNYSLSVSQGFPSIQL
jgi:hypothetical protein